MTRHDLRIPCITVLLLWTAVAHGAPSITEPQPDDAPDVYAYRPASRDGTGKVYMGREIAQVMGYLGISWLERPEREQSEMPRRVVKEMALRANDVVADLGAGSGYFSFRLSRRVPHGKVLAVDIQPEMLAVIEERAAKEGVSNVETVLGTATDPKLPPAAVDALLMVDAYHELSHPREVMQHVVRALKPGGRVVLVEYRGEDPSVPIKELHKMTEAQARLELEAVGLRWLETKDFLPQQHMLIFEKPLESGR